MQVVKTLLYFWFILSGSAGIAVAQQDLGTSATLEWLRNPKVRESNGSGLGSSSVRYEPDVIPLAARVVALAEEPVPAFRYRFWPAKPSLKPGSAQMHFYRAVMSYQSLTHPNQDQIMQLHALSGRELEEISAEEAAPWVNRLKTVFDELELMANSESFDWDFRFRDKQGKDIWMTQLEEVQQARSLARLLHLKIVVHIAKGEHDAAVNTIQTGFRLASFVGQGESLIQTLVGMAIEQTMYHAVDYAIHAPGFPNMYWALRTLPPQLSDVESAIETELEMSMRTPPILTEEEIAPLSDPEILRRLRLGLGDLKSLMPGSDQGIGATEMMAAILVASGSDAKRKLRAAGYDADRLAQLTDLQASLILSGVELRKQRDTLLKASKVGGLAGVQVGNKAMQEFEAWTQANRGSVAGIVASMLFPAVNNVVDAEIRTRLWRSRLIAIEALRHYAATHDGKLPANLESLVDTPIPFDPYTEKPFAYQVTQEGDTQIVHLSSEVPKLHESLRTVTVRFPQPN
jgi:hypothetical protein